MRLEDVARRYGRHRPWILRGADLVLEPGALVRIEGANSSGKSTLLRIAAGIERPTTGRAVLPARRAYVPERFPPALPFDARAYLRHLGRIHGLDPAEAARRAEHWLDRFGIADRAGTPLGELSKGTCQKVAVAQALLAEADLLVLDEAWTGLDRAARAELDSAAAERAAAGGRVLFVDHDPTRLAGLATGAYTVRDGMLHAAAPAARPAGGPDGRPPVRIVAEGLPAGAGPMPGRPSSTVLDDGATLLEVPAAASDLLLRWLLDPGRAVHVRSVTEAPAAPADRPATDREEAR
ncbi:ABC transporter ATP-binding protein [Kitasatospora sp. NE20-6]|uniref:ATP-binding cassette domain-containing protein n=1 Tax=Kitasatospora sp. NE20-6 TaxID=2859066 RepID=UPI0034DBFB3E